MIYPVITKVDDQPTFSKPLSEILSELQIGGALEVLSPLDYITKQQRAWFKGILLPALAKDSGDTVGFWETKLKLAVMPDEFRPFYVPLGKQVFPIIPSITILGKKKMNTLIEGSVAQCHEWGFLWVSLPDSELKR